MDWIILFSYFETHCGFGLPEKPLFVSEEIGLREWNISAIGTVSQQIVSFCGFKKSFAVLFQQESKSILNFLPSQNNK